jgi:periplasmic divalent cation tolerance protein
MEAPEADIWTVTTTAGSRPDAERLARAVVAARLAACAQLDADLTSVYRWQGQVCEEAEVRLTFKTTAQAEPALRAFIAAHHPYELPQYTCWPASATPGYAAWVRGEVAGDPR